MDPASIVGLIGAAASLTITCGRIIKGLHDLKEKYNDTNTTLSNIVLECRTLDTAATLIKEWIEGTPVGQQGSLGKLNETLVGFEAALKPVYQEVSDMLKKAKPSGILPRKVKFSAVWNETTMKEHLENVRWRAQALQLILAATLLPKEKRLERIEVIARSVASPQASRGSPLFNDASSALSDTEFDFDHELINTAAYRRALRSYFRASGSGEMTSSPTVPDEETEPAGKTVTDVADVEDLIGFPPDPAALKGSQDPQSQLNDYQREESIETVVGLESLRIMEEENEVPRDDEGYVWDFDKDAFAPFKADDSRSDTIQIPDLIVGVDFGTESTAVAFARGAQGEGPVRLIYKWPGRMNAVEERVPVVVSYNIRRPVQISSWGFQCEGSSNDETTVQVECFKPYLDPARLHLHQPVEEFTQEDVEKLCEDYLRCLCRHIEASLRGELSQLWATAAVEYLFSVPDGWGQEIVEKFHDIVFRAGFGALGGHTLHVSSQKQKLLHFRLTASIRTVNHRWR